MTKSRFPSSAWDAPSATRTTAAEAMPPPSAPRHQRLLAAIAGHTRIVDPETCLTALARLSASRALRRTLGPQIGTEAFRKAGFVAMLTLYALEPVPSDPEDLARDAEVDPARMTVLLGRLERQGLVACGPGQGSGRRPRVHLTEPGAQVIVAAVHRFLHLASSLAETMGSRERPGPLGARTPARAQG